MQVVAQIDHPEVREVAASHHCLVRFRERMPVREPGRAEVETALRAALEDTHVTSWPPGWVAGDRGTALWAITHDDTIAFPLERTAQPGRWLALTCLARGR